MSGAQPLAGVRVIDFTQVFLGPSATQMLADYGAEVIKIERPGSGELMRSERSFRPRGGGENAMFVALNRNKRSVALDLREPAGVEVVRRLLADADVLVHNFRPGVMARRGLDYEDLADDFPQLIYAVGSGYGPDGPLAELPGQDSLAQAMSGVIPRTGEPELPQTIYPTTFADYTGGMHLAIGVLLALRSREEGGRGQRVDVSLYNSLLALQTQEVATLLGHRVEINWAQTPLTGVFPTSDGALVLVGAFRPHPLREICEALGIGDLSEQERFADFEAQQRNRAELHALLGARLAELSSAEALAALRAADVLVAPVRDLGEALAEPQTEHNGMLLSFEQDGREVRTVASPIRLSETPAAEPEPAPGLGADAERVLGEAGYEPAEIEELRRRGVVA